MNNVKVEVGELRTKIVYDPGGGGTPLYNRCRYLPPHRLGFLRRFGVKTGKHFAHFGLESGMVFE